MKSAFDLSHVKGVRAVALLWQGEPAGRIVANYSDNPMGSVCTATVHVWKGPLAEIPSATGRARGYGYDKLSAAVMDAFSRAGKTWEKTIHDAGLDHGNGGTRVALEKLGYRYVEVC